MSIGKKHPFLFGKEINDYFLLLIERAIDFYRAQSRYKNLETKHEDKNRVEAEYDKALSFFDQQTEEIEKIFEKYLRIKGS